MQVIYKADTINLDLTDLARNRHNLIDIHGDITFDKCEDLVQSQPITFTSPESFIRAPQWDVKSTGTIQFQFRTNEPNGLLMYNSGARGSSHFFALETLDGFLYLLLDLGSGVAKVKATQGRVSDGLQHLLLLEHDGDIGKFSPLPWGAAWLAIKWSSQLAQIWVWNGIQDTWP